MHRYTCIINLKEMEPWPARSAAELQTRQRQVRQVVSETKRGLLMISNDLSDLHYMLHKHGRVG